MNQEGSKSTALEPTKVKTSGIAISVSPTEVRYFESQEAYEATRTQEDIERGVALAGAWGDLGMTEDELREALEKIRYESTPTPSLEEDTQ